MINVGRSKYNLFSNLVSKVNKNKFKKVGGIFSILLGAGLIVRSGLSKNIDYNNTKLNLKK